LNYSARLKIVAFYNIDQYNKESIGLILESLMLEKNEVIYTAMKRTEEMVHLLKDKGLAVDIWDDDQIKQATDAFMENMADIFK
jgi:hypothetical protein